jgi:ElaB/YqjD/DUF883 family membrane-anchored ribosome-binding protein
MGHDKGQVGTEVTNGERTPEQVQREIEATRQDLGDTAAALAAKTDVKARAKERLGNVKQTVTAKKDAVGQKTSEATPDGAASAVTQAKAQVRENPIPAAAIAAFLGGFLLGRITSR